MYIRKCCFIACYYTYWIEYHSLITSLFISLLTLWQSVIGNLFKGLEEFSPVACVQCPLPSALLHIYMYDILQRNTFPFQPDITDVFLMKWLCVKPMLGKINWYTHTRLYPVKLVEIWVVWMLANHFVPLFTCSNVRCIYVCMMVYSHPTAPVMKVHIA